MKFRGSITQRLISLSTLRREGRPSATQDSLPAAGPALPGGIGYPQGFDERFHIADSPFPSFVAQGRDQYSRQSAVLLAGRQPWAN